MNNDELNSQLQLAPADFDHVWVIPSESSRNGQPGGGGHKKFSLMDAQKHRCHAALKTGHIGAIYIYTIMNI